ncbi:MAG: cupin, partial [Desulfatiglandales bacterium]
MKILSVTEQASFNQLHMGRLLVHDSPYFKILSFSFLEGQELPVHSHEIEGEVSIFVMEGEGEFLGGEVPIPARAGDIMI